MRHSLLMAATLMVATTSLSWAQSDTTEGVPNVKQPDQENVQAQLNDTWQEIRNYGVEQKERALEAARQGLDMLDENIDELQKDMDEGWDTLSEQARANKEQALENLKKQREELGKEYSELQEATRGNWEAAKSRFGQAWEAAKDGWRELTRPAEKSDAKDDGTISI
ncbi:hypothetical protein A6D6_02007 [Alcanivorax xiamenensis]|uniref:Uncharacterized protein n=1 Tax=Alcanivorax xiamenensis TaxID=1177156 RepID=A0ABQ6Y8Z1_9GAMM|nr:MULTISPECIES: hypothetical protein [Alcanivorax]KAF0805746.1 hypothetical protein A6D6_02007 [Alcanivorax xiamenensis]